MPEVLLNIILVLFSAFVNACISYFLDLTFKETHIFHKWLPWLATKLLNKEDVEECNKLDDTPARRRKLIKFAEAKTFWFKPLGGCPACSNIWVGFMSFWVFAWYFHIPLIYFLPFLVISNFLLRRFLLKHL